MRGNIEIAGFPSSPPRHGMGCDWLRGLVPALVLRSGYVETACMVNWHYIINLALTVPCIIVIHDRVSGLDKHTLDPKS